MDVDKIELPDTFDIGPPTDFDFALKPQKLDTCEMPAGERLTRRTGRIQAQAWHRKQHAIAHLQALPPEGDSVYLFGGGKYGAWDIVPAILKLAEPAVIMELYASTWTISRPVAVELVKLFDEGKIQNVALLVGKYFKSRESGTFGFLAQSAESRSPRFRIRSALIHAKLVSMLLSNGGAITLHTSANLCDNQHIEAHAIIHDRKLFAFVKRWMLTLLDADG